MEESFFMCIEEFLKLTEINHRKLGVMPIFSCDDGLRLSIQTSTRSDEYGYDRFDIT